MGDIFTQRQPRGHTWNITILYVEDSQTIEKLSQILNSDERHDNRSNLDIIKIVIVSVIYITN